MSSKKIIFFVFLALFLLTASFATNIEVPSVIFVNDKPKNIWVTIYNDADYTRSLKVEFFAPIDYQIAEYPTEVIANGRVDVRITVYPMEKQNVSYDALLKVKLGNEVIKKIIRISFLSRAEQPQQQAETSTAPTGLFGLTNEEIFLDIGLFIVAILLMLAFISRYTRLVIEARK
ncbi:MAG: hypothetical protein J7L14_01690 [Candidatus Diapherotrites archaeon]|nr:hypothetical protein [Candidatus Diapherotrites archaeon]